MHPFKIQLKQLWKSWHIFLLPSLSSDHLEIFPTNYYPDIRPDHRHVRRRKRTDKSTSLRTDKSQKSWDNNAKLATYSFSSILYHISRACGNSTVIMSAICSLLTLFHKTSRIRLCNWFLRKRERRLCTRKCLKRHVCGVRKA